MQTLSIAARTIRFLGKKGTLYQLCRGSEVLRVYETSEQAEAALAAMVA